MGKTIAAARISDYFSDDSQDLVNNTWKCIKQGHIFICPCSFFNWHNRNLYLKISIFNFQKQGRLQMILGLLITTNHHSQGHNDSCPGDYKIKDTWKSVSRERCNLLLFMSALKLVIIPCSPILLQHNNWSNSTLSYLQKNLPPVPLQQVLKRI